MPINLTKGQKVNLSKDTIFDQKQYSTTEVKENQLSS